MTVHLRSVQSKHALNVSQDLVSGSSSSPAEARSEQDHRTISVTPVRLSESRHAPIDPISPTTSSLVKNSYNDAVKAPNPRGGPVQTPGSHRSEDDCHDTTPRRRPPVDKSLSAKIRHLPVFSPATSHNRALSPVIKGSAFAPARSQVITALDSVPPAEPPQASPPHLLVLAHGAWRESLRRERLSSRVDGESALKPSHDPYLARKIPLGEQLVTSQSETMPSTGKLKQPRLGGGSAVDRLHARANADANGSRSRIDGAGKGQGLEPVDLLNLPSSRNPGDQDGGNNSASSGKLPAIKKGLGKSALGKRSADEAGHENKVSTQQAISRPSERGRLLAEIEAPSVRKRKAHELDEQTSREGTAAAFNKPSNVVVGKARSKRNTAWRNSPYVDDEGSGSDWDDQGADASSSSKTRRTKRSKKVPERPARVAESRHALRSKGRKPSAVTELQADKAFDLRPASDDNPARGGTGPQEQELLQQENEGAQLPAQQQPQSMGTQIDPQIISDRENSSSVADSILADEIDQHVDHKVGVLQEISLQQNPASPPKALRKQIHPDRLGRKAVQKTTIISFDKSGPRNQGSMPGRTLDANSALAVSVAYSKTPQRSSSRTSRDQTKLETTLTETARHQAKQSNVADTFEDALIGLFARPTRSELKPTATTADADHAHVESDLLAMHDDFVNDDNFGDLTTGDALPVQYQALVNTVDLAHPLAGDLVRGMQDRGREHLTRATSNPNGITKADDVPNDQNTSLGQNCDLEAVDSDERWKLRAAPRGEESLSVSRPLASLVEKSLKPPETNNPRPSKSHHLDGDNRTRAPNFEKTVTVNDNAFAGQAIPPSASEAAPSCMNAAAESDSNVRSQRPTRPPDSAEGLSMKQPVEQKKLIPMVVRSHTRHIHATHTEPDSLVPRKRTAGQSIAPLATASRMASRRSGRKVSHGSQTVDRQGSPVPQDMIVQDTETVLETYSQQAGMLSESVPASLERAYRDSTPHQDEGAAPEDGLDHPTSHESGPLSSNAKAVPASPQADSKAMSRVKVSEPEIQRFFGKPNAISTMNDPFTRSEERRENEGKQQTQHALAAHPTSFAELLPTQPSKREDTAIALASKHEPRTIHHPLSSMSQHKVPPAISARPAQVSELALMLDQEVCKLQEYTAAAQLEEEDLEKTLVEHEDSFQDQTLVSGDVLMKSSSLAPSISQPEIKPDDIVDWSASLKTHQMNLFDELVRCAQRLTIALIEQERATERTLGEYHRRRLVIVEQEEKLRIKHHQQLLRQLRQKRADKKRSMEVLSNRIDSMMGTYQVERRQHKTQSATQQLATREMEESINGLV